MPLHGKIYVRDMPLSAVEHNNEQQRHGLGLRTFEGLGTWDSLVLHSHDTVLVERRFCVCSCYASYTAEHLACILPTSPVFLQSTAELLPRTNLKGREEMP